MEYAIQWVVIIVSLVILGIVLRNPPIGELLLAFFINAYISMFIGVLVVENKYLKYPVRFLPKIFESSLLFEYLAFPTLCALYHRTSRQSGFGGVFGQAVLYSGAMTALEVWIERNTDLIEYLSWSWLHTLLSTTAVLLFIRINIGAIRKLNMK